MYSNHLMHCRSSILELDLDHATLWSEARSGENQELAQEREALYTL